MQRSLSVFLFQHLYCVVEIGKPLFQSHFKHKITQSFSQLQYAMMLATYREGRFIDLIEIYFTLTSKVNFPFSFELVQLPAVKLNHNYFSKNKLETFAIYRFFIFLFFMYQLWHSTVGYRDSQPPFSFHRYLYFPGNTEMRIRLPDHFLKQNLSLNEISRG